MEKIKRIYDNLFTAFGSQGWWPIINNKTLLCEYHVNSPRSDKEALEICFGAILTQNTAWKNVEKAIANLNKNKLINANKILKISNERLASIIKPAGYYNRKAKKLKNFSYFLIKNYNGNLSLFFKNNIKTLREELLSINGIGSETADSIILYAAEKPIFVIDAYTKRIYSRIFNVKKELKYGELQKIFENNLEKDAKLFNEYHALLVELGKNYCKNKNPLCSECPVNSYCRYYKNH